MRTHGPLKLEGFVEPDFAENAYLLWTDDGPAAWIVDPGFPPHADMIRAAIEKHGLKPTAILVTHVHLDHIAGIAELRESYPDAVILAPEAEQGALGDPAANLSLACGREVLAPLADRTLKPGDTLTLGPLTWRVLDVSGHSIGGLAFHSPDAGIVLTGDALFAGSVGRTDFPGGSSERLLENIEQQLLTLPDETVIYSGHGPPTTIARERAGNPYLNGEPF